MPGSRARSRRQKCAGTYFAMQRNTLHRTDKPLVTRNVPSSAECAGKQRKLRVFSPHADGLSRPLREAHMVESLIAWLIVGAIAGWLAGLLVKGFGFGLIGNIVVGIIGAVIGGYLLPRLGIALGTGMVAAIINAVICAVILLVIIGLVRSAT